jgi:hypothetical protein
MTCTVETAITPPGPAGETHLRTIVEGVPTIGEAAWLTSLVSQTVATDRVGALYNNESGVLILNCFVHP